MTKLRSGVVKTNRSSYRLGGKVTLHFVARFTRCIPSYFSGSRFWECGFVVYINEDQHLVNATTRLREQASPFPSSRSAPMITVISYLLLKFLPMGTAVKEAESSYAEYKPQLVHPTPGTQVSELPVSKRIWHQRPGAGIIASKKEVL